MSDNKMNRTEGAESLRDAACALLFVCYPSTTQFHNCLELSYELREVFHLFPQIYTTQANKVLLLC